MGESWIVINGLKKKEIDLIIVSNRDEKECEEQYYGRKNDG
jgi:hypothetical protein